MADLCCNISHYFSLKHKHEIMKTIFSSKSVFVITLMFSFLSQMKIAAQYYKPSRKNFVVILGNTSEYNKRPILNPTLEFGKIKRDLYIFHGGLGARNSFPKTERSREITNTASDLKTELFAVAGTDMYFYGYTLLNLSRKNYCKYLVNTINFGVDLTKNLQGKITSGLGYRARAYLSFFIERTGSNKKDIGSRRELHLGYCFADAQLNNKNNEGTHSILVNIMLVKRKLIKFADWY